MPREAHSFLPLYRLFSPPIYDADALDFYGRARLLSKLDVLAAEQEEGLVHEPDVGR